MAQVPSNLIPIRVSQLDTAPVASEDGLLLYVYKGESYKIRAGDLLQVAGVPLSRQVIAGTGLQGGGQLSSNVTLSIAPGGVGYSELSLTGVTPGVYGDSTHIPVFTVDDKGRITSVDTVPVSASGFVPNTRQIIAGTGLIGGGFLNTDVTLSANLSNNTPNSVETSGSAGVSTEISRSDHKHPAVDLSDDDQVDNILGLNNGGTGNSIAVQPGAVIYSGADALYLNAAGTSGQLLQSTGITAPIWVDQTSIAAASAYDIIGGTANQIVYQSAADSTAFVSAPTISDTYLKWDGSQFVWVAVAGAGTVTSVNASGGTTGLTFSGGPITLAGTLTLGGTLAVASGGTGATSATDARTNLDVPSTSGSGATGTWGINISGNSATTTLAAAATNIAAGGANRIVYQLGAGSTSFITAPSVADTYLRWNGSSFDWQVNLLGTVTSVGTGTGLTGGPITTSGTINFSNAAVGTWAATPSSANLAAAMTDETGSGSLVFGTNPTLANPNIDVIDFDTAYATTLTAGQLGWDGNNTLGLGMAGGNVIQHIGEDQFFYCKATSTITKGQVIMFTGAVGASGVPTGAPATGITDGTYIMGIAAESIALNGFGLVQTFGTLRNVNTTGYADGDILWYDPSVTGGLTKTKPLAPNVKVQMAAVINGGSSGGGTILIRIDSGSVLGGTDANVGFGTLANNNLIQYDSVAGYWKNVAPSAITGVGSLANALTIGTGLSGTSYNGSSAVTIANTGVLSLAGTANQVTVSASTGAITISLPATINVNTSGNAATVTNGVYTTGSYADPSWITSLAGSKITGNISGNAGTATSLAGGAASQIPYQSAAGTTSFIPNGTAGQVLVSAGAGAPAWSGVYGGSF